MKIFGRYDLGKNYMVSSQNLPIYETAEKFTGPACVIHGFTAHEEEAANIAVNFLKK